MPSFDPFTGEEIPDPASTTLVPSTPADPASTTVPPTLADPASTTTVPIPTPLTSPAPAPKKRTLSGSPTGKTGGASSGKTNAGSNDRVFGGKEDRSGIQAKLMKAYFLDGSFVDPTDDVAFEARCAEIAKSLHLELVAVKTQIKRVIDSKPGGVSQCSVWSHQRWFEHNRSLQTTKAATPRKSKKERAKDTAERKRAESCPKQTQAGGSSIVTIVLFAAIAGLVFWLLSKFF